MSYASYEQQVVNAQRRRAIAQQLAQQAQESGSDRLQSVGGVVVPMNWGEALSKVGQGFIANKARKSAEALEDKTRANRETSMAAALEQYLKSTPDAQVGAQAAQNIAAAPDDQLAQPVMGRSEATSNLMTELAPREELAKILAQREMQPGFSGKLGPGDVAFVNGRQVAAAPPKEDDSVDYVDLGDRREPVSHRTGKPKSGLGPLVKGLPPAQAVGQTTDQQQALLGALIDNGGIAALGASGIRGQQRQQALQSLLDRHPDKTPDEIADGVKSGKIAFNVDQAAGKGAVSATTSALSQNEKLYAATSGYANTLDKNIDNLLKSYSKVDTTGSPLVNKAYRFWQQGVTGDADTAEMVTWLKAVQSEFAKLQSGSLGNAPASDAAMASAAETINKYMNQGGIQAVANVMRQEKANRLGSVKAESDRLRAQLKGGTPEASQLPPGVTEDDIAETMRANKMTREQVLQRLQNGP